MRTRFAPAAVLLVLAAIPAAGFDREPIQPGDTVTGDLLVGRTVDEYTIPATRGSKITLDLAAVGGGTIRPVPGLYGDDYGTVALIGTSAAHAWTQEPVAASQVMRVIVGSQGAGVGAYRLRARVKPAMRFSLAATAAAPATAFTFGAYAGFDAVVTLTWRGAAPVTVHDITGPDGALTSSEAPVVARTSSTQRGFHVPRFGDYVVTLDVPAGTRRWSAAVSLAGRLPRGTSHDFRTRSLPAAPAVLFPAAGYFPIVTVAGETGGPNQCLMSSSGTSPNAAFLGGGNRCQPTPLETGPAPGRYWLTCVDGYLARIDSVARGADNRIRSFEATEVRTPQGTGSASLANFTYDDAGHPDGWTEVRRFDSSGHSHELVFSRAEYFANGYCKAFRVVHRLLPDGEPATFDYAPFR